MLWLLIAIFGLLIGLLIPFYVLFFVKYFSQNEELPQKSLFQTVFPTRKIKKKPKFVSEEEQWKKEQQEPPRDPGL